MGRSKKGKKRDSNASDISATADVPSELQPGKDIAPSETLESWLGESIYGAESRYLSMFPKMMCWIQLDRYPTLLAGQHTVTARLDSVQDLSGSWGDCRLLLPPLSIYDAKLATSQHVLVLPRLLPGRCWCPPLRAQSWAQYPAYLTSCAGRRAETAGGSPC